VPGRRAGDCRRRDRGARLRGRDYTQQAQDRHALDDIVVGSTDSPGSTKVITVRARWSANGIAHVGNAQARPGVKVGNRIDDWFDNAGRQVKAPTPVAHPYRDVDGSV
jgi:hypothetical protein